MKKGPFQMKYNASPLRSQLNSPLKQSNWLTWFNQNLNPFTPSADEIDYHKTNREQVYNVDGKETTIDQELANTTAQNTIVRNRKTGVEQNYLTIPCADGNCGHFDADLNTEGHQMLPGEEYDQAVEDHKIMDIKREKLQEQQEQYPSRIIVQNLPEVEVQGERKYYYPKGSSVATVDHRSRLAQMFNPRRKIKGGGEQVDPVEIETQYGT